MRKLNSKTTDFINGILSLIISQVLVKIFGVIYTLYLTNRTGFGDEGNAIYMSGYQIYALLLTISSIGVPNAISKIISEKKTEKDYINKDRVFKIAIFLFAVIGFLGCVYLFVLSEFIATKILEIPEATLSLKVLSPAVFFVSVSSVIKGYCNGENKIYITAKAQFFEQVIKSILTIIFVEMMAKISNNNTKLMAAIANFATTIATFLSFIYMIYKYIKIKNKNIYFTEVIYKKERIMRIVKKVLIIAVPMTLNAILSSLGRNVDALTVVKILKSIIGEESAIKKYGIISSKVDILITLPLSFNTSISTALIPEISRKKTKNDLNGIIKKIKFSILITLIIGVPYMFGVYTYSKQIFELLFPNAKEGYQLLRLASLGIVFSMLTQTINGILQGLGKNDIPVYASLMGLIVKICSNIFLIRIEGIYEKGAILGNILSSIVSFIIVYIVLIRNVELKNSILKLLFKPIIASIVMILISKNIYNYLIIIKINSIFCTVCCIVIAVIIYVFNIFVMKMLNKNDIFESVENTEV